MNTIINDFSNGLQNISKHVSLMIKKTLNLIRVSFSYFKFLVQGVYAKLPTSNLKT